MGNSNISAGGSGIVHQTKQTSTTTTISYNDGKRYGAGDAKYHESAKNVTLLSSTGTNDKVNERLAYSAYTKALSGNKNFVMHTDGNLGNIAKKLGWDGKGKSFTVKAGDLNKTRTLFDSSVRRAAGGGRGNATRAANGTSQKAVGARIKEQNAAKKAGTEKPKRSRSKKPKTT